jgi:hypothetical protein
MMSMMMTAMITLNGTRINSNQAKKPPDRGGSGGFLFVPSHLLLVITCYFCYSCGIAKGGSEQTIFSPERNRLTKLGESGMRDPKLDKLERV